MFDKAEQNSWNDFLIHLKINPSKITKEDIVRLLHWCQTTVKSDFSPKGSINSQVAEIKRLFNAFNELNKHKDLGETCDGLTQSTALLQAARVGFDCLLDSRLAKMNNAAKQELLKTTNEAGNNALHIAALFGQELAVKVLLKHDCSPDVSNKLNKLPIHLSLSNTSTNNPSCFNALLASTDPSLLLQQDSDGENLLFYSIRAGLMDLATQLLKISPTLGISTNRLGETAYHIAIQLGHGDVLPVLGIPSSVIQSRNVRGETLFHYAARMNDIKTLTWLLEIDPNLINSLDFQHHNALEIILHTKDPINSKAIEVVSWLLAHHIDIDKKDNSGKSLRVLLDEDSRFSTFSIPRNSM